MKNRLLVSILLEGAQASLEALRLGGQPPTHGCRWPWSRTLGQMGTHRGAHKGQSRSAQMVSCRQGFPVSLSIYMNIYLSI